MKVMKIFLCSVFLVISFPTLAAGLAENVTVKKVRAAAMLADQDSFKVTFTGGAGGNCPTDVTFKLASFTSQAAFNMVYSASLTALATGKPIEIWGRSTACDSGFSIELQ